MFHIFSDIFSCRENILTRQDPRVKLIISFFLIILVISSENVIFPSLIFAGAFSTALFLKFPLKLIFARVIAPFGIALVLLVIKTFITGSTPLFTIKYGWLELTARKEGLIEGILLSSRVLGSVSVVLLLGLVTPAHKVFHALLWFRLPKVWVEVAMTMYRYIFILLDTASDMATAQRVRLGYNGAARSLSSLGMLAGGVILRSVDQAVNTYDAMIARGYKGYIPFVDMPPLSKEEKLATLFSIVVVLFFYAAFEWRVY